MHNRDIRGSYTYWETYNAFYAMPLLIKKLIGHAMACHEAYFVGDIGSKI